MEFWSFLGGNASFQLLKGYFFLDFEKSHHFSVKKVVTFFQKSQFGNNLYRNPAVFQRKWRKINRKMVTF